MIKLDMTRVSRDGEEIGPREKEGPPALESQTLSRTIRGLSHDMNNPLGAIRLHLQLVESMIPDDLSEVAQIRESLSLMDGCVSRIHEIMGAIRRVARDESDLKRAEIDLADLLRSAVGNFASRHTEPGVKVELREMVGLPAVWADGKLMLEAVESILDSVIATLSGSAEIRRIAISASYESGKHRVCCTVRSSGAGNAAGWEKSPESPGGPTTGLGLQIARSICRAHGGDLLLAREPGEGVSFTFWVPCA